jgi:hypothetical protein
MRLHAGSRTTSYRRFVYNPLIGLADWSATVVPHITQIYAIVFDHAHESNGSSRRSARVLDKIDPFSPIMLAIG